MKKKLTNNLALKIASVVIAFIIWLGVSAVNDPVKTNVRYPVKVTVTNADYIYDSGKTYQIEEENRTVTVYVTGKESVVEGRTDIVVEADMTQIVDMDSDPAYVPVTLKSIPGISTEDVTIIPRTIPVSIEDAETKDFMITVLTDGTPGNGYVVGAATSSPEKITIQGPESIINKIKSVVATVDVEGITKDTSTSASISLIDQNGEVMTDTSMEYLEFFNIQEDRTVDVSVELWEVVDDVRVEASYTGSPASGYQVDQVTTTPDTISVAGSDEALAALEEAGNVVTIPGEMIDINGVNGDFEVSITLSSVLKEEDGYKIPDDATQLVQVRVSILPQGSEEFKISTSDIEVDGLAKGKRLVFNQDYLTVRVKGTEEGLENLKAEDISASIDLDDVEDGESTIPVSITLPAGYQQVETATVTVRITDVETTPTATPTEEAESTSD